MSDTSLPPVLRAKEASVALDQLARDGTISIQKRRITERFLGQLLDAAPRDPSGSPVLRSAKFVDSLFDSEVTFRGVVFREHVSFMRSRFLELAAFTGSTFEANAIFSFTTFRAGAGFARTTFLKLARFGGSTRAAECPSAKRGLMALPKSASFARSRR